MRVSIVIPTFRRENVLLDTLRYVRALRPPALETLVVDQTQVHERSTEETLAAMAESGEIRWIRLSPPSIPRAMNLGMKESRGEIVLFLDDDVIPGARLIEMHSKAHDRHPEAIIAGQILQPGEEALAEELEVRPFRFNSSRPEWIAEFMGCNFSVRRGEAIRLGGFDENFVGAAYRFEADFARRHQEAGGRIRFEPEASLRHLKSEAGGTRAAGTHLKTWRPTHAVGEFYYVLRWERGARRWKALLARLYRSIHTRHHFRRPWWIPVTLVAELSGLAWAFRLRLGGPRLMERA